MNYLNVTFNQLVQDYKARLASDPRFKNISSSTIYGMFCEFLAAVTDMTNFYIQRASEEAFISTARLDSSIIKHCKNLGYMPRRPVPAQCELVIRLKGPLPETIKEGTRVFFNQDTTKLSFNGNPYILDSGYSYTFTAEDITNGASADWIKDLRFAVPDGSATYVPVMGMNIYNTKETTAIKCFQAEQKTVEFLGTANMSKIGENCQFYDIDDTSFSNWYGKRDPFAFSENIFYPEYSWCKVGVGPDENTAFNDENLYTVETQSIMLNEDIVNLNGVLPEEPFKVCLIETNPDKTVRVWFSPNALIADIGLKSIKDNIYVRYLSTQGKSCNMTGVTGTVMTHNNQINAVVDGSVVSLTNNVQFIINSDIYGGEYFESQASMKINAPAYFSSRGKLVTKDDYLSYFRALSSPMAVQTAMVFSQHDIERMSTHDSFPLLQNNILYCLMGHLYLKNPRGNWMIRNVLTEIDSGTSDTFSLYGEEYLNHLCDYIKMLYSYQSYYNTMYSANPEEQWLKNIQLIHKNCIHNTEINTVMLSLPPYVQYFDLVGTVYVKPLTDTAEYLLEMQNKVYEYLDNRIAKHKKIYKSEIVKLYNEHPATESVDITFKISNIIQSERLNYNWSKAAMPDFSLIQDTTLESYAAAQEEIKNRPDYIGGGSNGTNLSIVDVYGSGWWNKLKLPKYDQNGLPINSKMFENHSIIMKCYFYNRYKSNPHSTTVSYYEDTDNTCWSYSFRCSISTDENYIYICPINLQPQYYRPSGTDNYTQRTISYRYMTSSPNFIANNIATDDGVIKMTLSISQNNDYCSTSNFSELKTEEYGITSSQIKQARAILEEWLNNDGNMITSAERDTIALPYKVYSDTTMTREETIMRRGNIIRDDNSLTISEYTFWHYLVPRIINECYVNADGTPMITAETDINESTWTGASNLIMDIYPLVKPGICDSILDDNNNITNFSTEMERACVQNLVNVRYYKKN